MIKEYLKKNKVLITDGAMGTYYSQITGEDTTFSEIANIKNPSVIKRIHIEYIEAGANLIRTNTFLANSISLNVDRKEAKEIIKNGYRLAKEAIKDKKIFIAASIGPIINNKESTNEEIEEEYKFMVDSFIEVGVEIFLFETFSDIDEIVEIIKYIKKVKKDSFIITQFALMINGYTKKGIGVKTLIQKVKKMDEVDIYGFNCGTGPIHLYNNLKEIDFGEDIVSVLPNAGFPEIINRKTVYTNNPNYFSDIMVNIFELGVKIIGGCCGTTPQHIKMITKKMEEEIKIKGRIKKNIKEKGKKKKEENTFFDKLKKDEFVVAVELDPPFGTDIEKIMKAAKILKEETNTDIITISDSPIGKVRINSTIIASKIKREIGIDVMPHICCRDRNMIGLKSDLLGGHVENIRNLLLVTGDPIPSSDRNEIKSVFNFNSLGLMNLVSTLNNELLAEETFNIGGALNLNVLNKQTEINRMYKKIENGANYFLTQPIFEENVIEELKKLKKDKNVKILGGVMPLVSYRNAQFLNNEIPGINIPDKYVNRFKKDMDKETSEKIGIEIAVDLAKQMKEYVDGFYFITPFNRANMIKKIMKKLEL